MSVFVEAIVVGVVITLVWSALNVLMSSLLSNETILWLWSVPLSLFLAGFFGHLLFEVIGANKWYCKHGAACNK